MDKRPEISIIIPIYNIQDYVERCLDSVKNQTFQNWEAICINDGSTDNSLDILQKYAQEDDRFVIVNKENGGVSSARNVGLEKAIGNYVMFLDGDDFIHPQCMELALKTIKINNSDICDFQLKKVQEIEKISYQQFSENTDAKVISHPLRKIIEGKADRGLLNFCKKIYKSEIAKKVSFNSLSVGEDVLYSFQALNLCKKICTIPYCFLFYVQRESSISHEKDKQKRYKQKVIFITHLLDAVNNVAVDYNSDGEYVKSLRKYISHKIFNIYVMRPYKTKFPTKQIQDNLSQLSEMVKNGDCDISLLCLRFRIIYYLLSRNHYYLAKLFV